jgi:hypothetical protein
MITKTQASRISSLIATYDANERIQTEWMNQRDQETQGSRKYNSYHSLTMDSWHSALKAELSLLEEFGISIYYQDDIEGRVKEVKRLIVIARESSNRLAA